MQLLRAMLPIQLAFLLFLFTGYSSLPWLFVTYLYFSNDCTNRSSPSFSCTTFRNFPSISPPTFRSGQVSAPYKAMLQIMNFISFFLKFQSNLLVKKLFIFECFFCYGNPGFNFICTPCIIVIMLPKQMKYSTYSSWVWCIIISILDVCL